MPDVQKTVLAIVNTVQKKLGLLQTSTLTENAHAEVLTTYLADILSEISDDGDWPELYGEVAVSLATSTAQYKVQTSVAIKNILEIGYENQFAPLNLVTVKEIRQLNRRPRFGIPRNFTIVRVSDAKPVIEVAPIPGTNEASDVLNVAVFKRPRMISTSDATYVVPFPATLVEQGLYYKALLEESEGPVSAESKQAFPEYQRMLTESRNRFTSDTEEDMSLTP